jgi:hypothetical protein
MNVTYIEYNMNAATGGSTYNSATIAVFSDYFVAKDISFKVIPILISTAHLKELQPTI